MSFVFLSHASQDKPVLGGLVRALLGHGLSLWIDKPSDPRLGLTQGEIAQIQRIRAGEEWRNEIEEAKKRAGCVLACWSKHATTEGALSGKERHVWFAEVSYARTEEKLVCCAIDDVQPHELPDGYADQQIINLCPTFVHSKNPKKRVPRSEAEVRAEISLLAGDIQRKIAETVSRREQKAAEPELAANQLAAAIISHVRQGIGVEQRVGVCLLVSQRAERFLRSKFSAQGQGLGTCLTSVREKALRLDANLYDALREFVPLRNKIAHDVDAAIDATKLERVLQEVVAGLGRHDTASNAPPSVATRRRRVHVGPKGMAEARSTTRRSSAPQRGLRFTFSPVATRKPSLSINR